MQIAAIVLLEWQGEWPNTEIHLYLPKAENLAEILIINTVEIYLETTKYKQLQSDKRL